MTSSAQLERETEQTRARVAETLEELRTRMTAGQVLDQVVDYARDSGGGEFVRNLGRQIVGNPLPVALIGAGLAWLMLANGRATARPPAVSAPAQRLGGQLDDTADRIGASAGSAVGAVRDRPASAGDRLGSAYDSAAGTATRAASAVGSQATTLGTSLAEASRNLTEFCKEQPLVLAGLGLAIGAAIGATMTVSEAENRLMGEASDEVKRRAQALAEEQVQRTKAAVEAYQEARPQAGNGHAQGEHGQVGEAQMSASEPTRGDNIPV
jgi:hypothetical protein